MAIILSGAATSCYPCVKLNLSIDNTLLEPRCLLTLRLINSVQDLSLDFSCDQIFHMHTKMNEHIIISFVKLPRNGLPSLKDSNKNVLRLCLLTEFLILSRQAWVEQTGNNMFQLFEWEKGKKGDLTYRPKRERRGHFLSPSTAICMCETCHKGRVPFDPRFPPQLVQFLTSCHV